MRQARRHVAEDLRSVEGALASFARGVLGPDYTPELPRRMLHTLSLVASATDRRRLVTTMRALDTRAGALALTGKPVPVSWLPGAEAEALLQAWKTSKLAPARQLAAVLITLATTGLYGHPGPHWDRIGYQGPLGPPPEEPKRLHPLAIDEPTEMRCDVVVVGSGAGGGCAAGILAEAGLDVVVLEKGGYRNEADFHHRESQAMQELYLYGGSLTTTDLGCRVLAGSTLGGGTVVNYATTFQAPDYVLKQWAETSGIDAFVNGDMAASFEAVSRRVNVNTEHSRPSKRDELLRDGLTKLGWHNEPLPRAAKGCSHDVGCGWCGFGCRVGGKQSSMRTYLEDAAGHGARMVVGADVRKVIVSGDRAEGVEAVAAGHRLTVRARAVIAAAGAIETPALLLRSGVKGEVGKNLRLHPGTAAWGRFDDEVRAWEGTLQAVYSGEFRHWDGGWGPLFETVPIHPGAGSAAFPWLSASQHREMMTDYRHISFCANLTRDSSAGRVRIARDGSPRVDYKLNGDDQRRVAEGVIRAAQVLEAAGATEVSSPHALPCTYRPGTADAHRTWADETRERGYARDVTFFSYHQMGSCRMGTDPSTSVVDADNESHHVKDLYVMDGSTFPLASGVNPMLSIYAIAHRGATKLAARLS